MVGAADPYGRILGYPDRLTRYNSLLNVTGFIVSCCAHLSDCAAPHTRKRRQSRPP
jgi:hypothetical protein